MDSASIQPTELSLVNGDASVFLYDENAGVDDPTPSKRSYPVRFIEQDDVELHVAPTARVSHCRLFSDSPAVCRICHSGECSSPFSKGQPLISPCHCRGTMGLYHRGCLEKWLGSSNTSQCEICKFPYVTRRSPKGFIEFMKNPGNPTIHRNMIADLICFFLLTPLAGVATWLCIAGAVHYAIVGQRHVEVPGLITLAFFLVITYCVWLAVSLRYHHNTFHSWRAVNHNVRVLGLDEIAAAATGGRRCSLSTSACSKRLNMDQSELVPLRSTVMVLQSPERSEQTVATTAASALTSTPVHRRAPSVAFPPAAGVGMEFMMTCV